MRRSGRIGRRTSMGTRGKGRRIEWGTTSNKTETMRRFYRGTSMDCPCPIGAHQETKATSNSNNRNKPNTDRANLSSSRICLCCRIRIKTIIKRNSKTSIIRRLKAKIHFSKCSNNLPSKGAKTSLKGKDSLTTKPIIPWTSRTKQSHRRVHQGHREARVDLQEGSTIRTSKTSTPTTSNRKRTCPC